VQIKLKNDTKVSVSPITTNTSNIADPT